jgi:LEA14-like dessication related protein
MENLKRFRHGGIAAGMIALVFSLWGCAINQSNTHRPRISLANIQIEEISTFETILRLDLMVENVKSDILVIEGLDYTVKINDVLFASGLSNSPMEIPPHKTGTLPIIINSSLMEMINTKKSIPTKESIHYSVTGYLRIKESGLLEPSHLPFGSAGKLHVTSSQ